jgi:hypothetical protein
MISQSLQETIITVISKPVEFDGIRIYTMDGSTYEIGDTLSENYFELKATYKILYMQRGERKIIMSIIERKS